MFADKDSRGGVLEAEGTVEIKFREKDLVKVMHRLDPVCVRIKEQLAAPQRSVSERSGYEREMKKREELLTPIYHQVAVQFADLHDTPGRMQEKGCVVDVVNWANSRRYLYWRLRRLLLEEEVKKKLRAIKPDLTHGLIKSMLSRWFVECEGTVKSYLWEDNKTAVEWLSQQLDKNNWDRSILNENIKCVQRDQAVQQVRNIIQENPEIGMESVVQITQHMTAAQRAEVARLLSSMDTNTSST